MKKIYVLLISLLFACGNDDSGTMMSDPIRYEEDLFAEVDLTLDVKYGRNAPLLGGQNDLYLDIYQPSGDVLTHRPLIVLAHGGFFLRGNKTEIRELCENYAKKGFVVASIQYRLINDPTIMDSIRFSEGAYLAIADMKAAIRHLRKDAKNDNRYGINPDMIFAGGISSGAIIANHLAYMDETDNIPNYFLEHINRHGGFEGNTNDLQVSSSVNGVISFSGSLLRKAWITSEDTPIFMVHEELDPIVPCNNNIVMINGIALRSNGACILQSVFEAANVSYSFLLVKGSNQHLGYLLDKENAKRVVNASSKFLHGIINGTI